MENERDNDDGERLPPIEDLGTKNHDCSVPAIPSNDVQTMSMEIGKVGISDNDLKVVTKSRRFCDKLGYNYLYSQFTHESIKSTFQQ